MAEKNKDATKASESLTEEVARHVPDMGSEVARHVPEAAGEVAHHAPKAAGEVARHAQGVAGEVAFHSQEAADDVVRETPVLIEHLKESLSGLFGGLKDDDSNQK